MTFENILRLAMDNKNLKFRSSTAKCEEQTWDTVIFWLLLSNQHMKLKKWQKAEDWEVIYDELNKKRDLDEVPLRK